MSTIRLKGIVAEDFVNYKKPSLFLISSICNWKCCKEANIPITICQNNPLIDKPTKEFGIESIYTLYMNNDITKAIVIGGLEPFMQFDEFISLIDYFRKYTDDDIVIYTGYYEEEIKDKIELLKQFPNIIIKYGRYVPNNSPHYDEILGVNLISDNQYAEKIS